MTSESQRVEGPGLALYLTSAGLSFFAHNVFVYTMVTLGRALSGSDAVSGSIFFCTFFPIIVLTFVAGAVADRRSRRATMVVTQWAVAAIMLLAVAFVRLEVVGPGREWPLFVVALLYGLVASFAIPARLSFVGNLARGRLAERVMVGINVLQFVGLGAGPGVAAFVRTHGGWAHMFSTVAVLCFLSGLLMLPVKERYPQPASASASAGTVSYMLAGIRYALGERTLTQLFAIAALLGFCMFGPFQVLMPEFGRSVLALSEQQRGLYMFPFGFGLLIGGGAAGALIPNPHRGLLLIGSTGLAASLFLLLPALQLVAASAALLLGLGACGGMSSALLMASLTTLAADDQRGRVMSIFSWTLTGTTAAGGAAFGALARGNSVTLSIHAAGALAVALVGLMFALGRDLRRLTNAPQRA
jgi:MFS family permease